MNSSRAHLHIVEQCQAGQRCVGRVVQRSRQDDVLDVLDAVRLVDLGDDGGLVDGHHLLELNAALLHKQGTGRWRCRVYGKYFP